MGIQPGEALSQASYLTTARLLRALTEAGRRPGLVDFPYTPERSVTMEGAPAASVGGAIEGSSAVAALWLAHLAPSAGVPE